MTLQELRRVQRLRAAVVVAGFMVTMALLYAALPAYGQSGNPEWDVPLYLGDGWWQSMTVDIEGTAHITWYGGREDYDALLYRQRSLAGVWSDESDVLLTVTGGYTIRNSLAATTDGILHVAYRHETFHRFASAPIVGVLSAANWTSPVDVSDAGYYIKMTSDRDDVLHIVYAGPVSLADTPGDEVANLESDPCAFCADLIYIRSTNGGHTWSNPRNLSNTREGGAQRQTIFQGNSGRLYATWDEGLDWYVGRGLPQGARLAYSDDNGISWSDAIALLGNSTTPGTFPIQFAMAEMPNQEIMAVWRYSNDIDRNAYYQTSQDGGNNWTDPQPIPFVFTRGIDDTPLDHYALVTDLTGGVHLFMVGYNEIIPGAEYSNPAVFHLEYRQGAWRTVRLLSYSPNYRPEWPEADIGPNNELHVSWFSRTINEDGVDWKELETGERGLEVFYTYRPGTLRTGATQVFRPTQTPPPTATSALAFQSTATPFPTIGPIENPASIITSDNYGAQVILFAGGASVVLCVCVLIAYGFRPRR